MTAEHRVSGRRLRRFPDPERSDDPRVIAVLEQLRSVEIAPAPRTQFRAELRAQLVAIAPRIVAEGADASAATGLTPAVTTAAVGLAERPRPTPRPRPVAVPSAGTRAEPTHARDSVVRKLRQIPIARPLAVAASIVTLLALVLGGAVWMSQDAVPGDTLYGLKRASENFELSRADNDTERAQLLLQFATTRVDEANELISQPSASAAGAGPLADGRLSGHTSSLIAKTLSSADDNTRTASQLLGGAAVKSASGRSLSGVKTWAPEQIARLSRLRASLPAGADLRSTATKSADLVQAVATRMATLQKRVGCDCLSKAPKDSLGPVPYAVPSAPKTTAPSKPTKSSTPGGSNGGSKTTAPRNSGGGTSTKARTSNAPAPRTSTPTLPTLPLPSIKLPAPPTTSKTPIIDLCKISLLGIKICPSSSP